METRIDKSINTCTLQLYGPIAQKQTCTYFIAWLVHVQYMHFITEFISDIKIQRSTSLVYVMNNLYRLQIILSLTGNIHSQFTTLPRKNFFRTITKSLGNSSLAAIGIIQRGRAEYDGTQKHHEVSNALLQAFWHSPQFCVDFAWGTSEDQVANGISGQFDVCKRAENVDLVFT